MTDSKRKKCPPRWETAALDNLISFVIGGDWGKAPNHEHEGYTDAFCIRGTEIKTWKQDKGATAALRRIKKTSLEKRMLCEGDIILEVSGGGPEQPVGRVELVDTQALAQNPGTPKVCTNFFRRMVPVQELNPPYLVHYLKYFYSRGDIKKYQAGSNNLRNLKYNEYKMIGVPIPPLNEQHRIVEKIETLFAHIDKGEEALREIQKLLKRYRQSILKAAVTGELTRDWREANRDKLEPASDLLARVLEARQENWQGRGKYKEPVVPDTAHLPELPEDWVWAPLDGLCIPEKHALKAGPFGSSLKKSDYSESGYKIYGQEQVIGGDWTIGDYFIEEKKFLELQNCSVSPRDVLISLVGTIGKVLILPPDCSPGIINPRLVKISLQESFYLPEFFKLYFESSFLKSLYKLDAHGATMDVLNLGIIRKLPYPLCSLEEQRLIIARATEALDSADTLESWCKTELLHSTSLRQSILKSAFTGQLVPQDANDEPASKLLARIHAEREATTKKRSKKKVGKKTRAKA